MLRTSRFSSRMSRPMKYFPVRLNSAREKSTSHPGGPGFLSAGSARRASCCAKERVAPEAFTRGRFPYFEYESVLHCNNVVLRCSMPRNLSAVADRMMARERDVAPLSTYGSVAGTKSSVAALLRSWRPAFPVNDRVGVGMRSVAPLGRHFSRLVLARLLGLEGPHRLVHREPRDEPEIPAPRMPLHCKIFSLECPASLGVS